MERVQPVSFADRRFAEAGAEDPYSLKLTPEVLGGEEFLAAAKGSVIGFDVERVRRATEIARHTVERVFCSGEAFGHLLE